MNQLFNWLDRDDNIRKGTKRFAEKGCHSIYGVSGSVKSLLLSKAMQEQPGQYILIVPSKEEQGRWQTDLSTMLPDVPVLDYPLVDRAVFTTTAKSIDRASRQMEALSLLQEGRTGIIIATAGEAAQYVPSPQQLNGISIDVRSDADIERDDFIAHLAGSGYERVDMVERRGHFAVRGDIVDVYAINKEHPLRVEFFGDTIDSLRYFDEDTQKSIETAQTAHILPAAAGELSSSFQGTLIDYGQSGVIIWDEPNRIRESLKKFMKEADEYKKWLAPWKSLVAAREGTSQIVLSLMAQAVPDMTIDTSTSFSAKMMASFQKQFDLLGDEIAHWQKNDDVMIFVMASAERSATLQGWMRKQGWEPRYYDDAKALEEGQIYIADGEIHNGFELPYAKVIVLSERDVYGMQKHRLRHRVIKGQEINVFTDLKPGDYVVHEAHGIGRYMGIKTIELDGVHKDYLEVHYAGKDILYIPTDQLQLLQRYIGNEGDVPHLSKMGGTDWHKARAKAQKSVDDLAEKLVKVYAKREIVKGYAFPPDTVYQKEFEDAFPYEETADQLKAVRDIKASMEKPYPMDCLVCGDVGFGKTEVAMRAIYKAVMGGKQVAVLVPTTVLAQQHFQTFSQRFDSFGVAVDVLNRFRSAKDKKDILKRTKDGDIDVLIGTHSILNKRVQFKDLGLLVVDEEQRFGVAQKEKWKAWAANIDVLSLSATPIPRTLHMSLVNLRQLCVIETPPTDRFPVQTYVTEYDAAIVRDAVIREKRRNGQVFFVYNRVATIERMKDELQALLPDMTIGIAHGQMSGSLLERIMFDFYEGKYDILLCSSLVENGLDVANANTIIVYDADHFGLSQLYQMRGRVGRSHRMAYAYFLYRRDKVLSEVAEKRLQAIKEFTELGSGFKIAMRDLEIRGAGNLLGREQHGNIASVGFAMYCQMLEQAIAKAQKGETKVKAPVHTIMETNIDAFIDNQYISNGGQKIEMYQRIAAVETEEELDSLEKELVDRYGKPTKPVQTLLKGTRTRLRAQAMGIDHITQKRDAVEIKWHNQSAMPPLVKMAPAKRKRLYLVPGLPSTIRVSLTNGDDILVLLDSFLTEADNLRKGNQRA